ncbi:hypothetical protein GCM10017783_01860 [Deinococcus piscis]|uniref:Lipoprotein n=1 Tax=Deinococcus piscis TaxID=394230 RepID=A0ABQ3K1Q2_9DEIO|nr:hypothetical protein GCM10017783_01860 [Deinococcus piscis]
MPLLAALWGGALLGACAPAPAGPEWSQASAAEQRAWKDAAGTDPVRDVPDIVAATLDFPAQTQTVAYVTLRSDRPTAEVTLKSLSAELQPRFPEGMPDGHIYQERWLVGTVTNTQCEPPQLRVLALAGELPPREGQEWTGALGLLPDPEPCSGLEGGAVNKSFRQEPLRLNEWNVIHSTLLGGSSGEVAVTTAIYPTAQPLPVPAGARAEELVLLTGQGGAALNYGDLTLPALPEAGTPPNHE